MVSPHEITGSLVENRRPAGASPADTGPRRARNAAVPTNPRIQDSDEHSRPTQPPDSGRSLDPADWRDYRATLHALVDRCVDALEDVRDRPWQPVDDALLTAIALGDAARAPAWTRPPWT